MFESHLLSMALFAALVSLMLACLKAETRPEIVKAAAKNFFFMAGGVIVAGWIMRVL
jgi:hypothetical protein